MRSRLFATLSESTHPPKVKHYLGLPPELADGKDTRKQMGSALFLVIENNSDGVFLYRFNANGDCVGDTWHATVDDAKDQAAHEFEGFLSIWQEVPQTIDNAAVFALARARQS